MKTFRKLFVASAALLSITACSVNNGLPISNKDFTYDSFTEIKVDEGLYGSESGYIGANKDELATKVIGAVVIPNTKKLKVGDVPTTGHTYNGENVKVYAVSDYNSEEGFSSNKCYALPTATENEYRFLRNVGGGSLELENLTFELGYRSSTHSSTSEGTIITTYHANVTFEIFKFNKEAGTLTTSVLVKDTKTVNDEATTKSGTFTLTFKA